MNLDKCVMTVLFALTGVTLGSTASAGPECQGNGTWNASLPGPAGGSVGFELIWSQSGRFTAWASGVLTYSSDGQSAATDPSAPAMVAFSDRPVCTPGPTPMSFSDCSQKFSSRATDSWAIRVDQDGVITITNLTWGGEAVVYGACSGTAGQIVGLHVDASSRFLFPHIADAVIVMKLGAPQAPSVNK